MLKRLIDILLSGSVLLAAAPLLLILAVTIRWRLGSPVFFRQPRPGLHGKPFTMLKFRSMRNVVNEAGEPLPDSERLTPFGNWLRSTSLDELPGLLSVLRGEMSLVGPRPLLMEYLPLYSAEQMRRHNVKPGLTGWAQVNGRNALNWDQKFALDLWYVANQSLLLDIRIMALTVGKVLRRTGIAAEGEATMSRFTGNVSEQADRLP